MCQVSTANFFYGTSEISILETDYKLWTPYPFLLNGFTLSDCAQDAVNVKS